MALLKLTRDNFETEVLNSTLPVLIDFYADWCGPCRMLGPVIDEIAEEATDFKVGKVNIDEQPELATKYQVMSVPTLVVIKNGEVANRVTGVTPKQKILDMIE
ncbi:MAG: thioredoxin [Lachnospiraceae bacterium]|nr:thioredoxin [Lachnospiraceae bacterium]MBQ6787573.1 thioredoxin [Lachnospiraceae bacterium]